MSPPEFFICLGVLLNGMSRQGVGGSYQEDGAGEQERSGSSDAAAATQCRDRVHFLSIPAWFRHPPRREIVFALSFVTMVLDIFHIYGTEGVTLCSLSPLGFMGSPRWSRSSRPTSTRHANLHIPR